MNYDSVCTKENPWNGFAITGLVPAKHPDIKYIKDESEDWAIYKCPYCNIIFTVKKDEI